MTYTVTIYGGYLDESPDVAHFDTHDEATDYILSEGSVRGYDMSDDEQSQQYFEFVRLKEAK